MIRVETLPPNYTETDQARRDEIYQQIRDLHEEVRERMKPLTAELVEIHSRYAPRFVVCPDDHDGFTEPQDTSQNDDQD